MNRSDVVAGFCTGLQGIVQRWEVVNPDGSIAQSGGDYKNLILDQGMDMPGSNYYKDLSTYCAVGTDNTAPTQTDTGLGTEVARTGNTSVANTDFDGSAKTVTHHREFEFAQGALDGTYYEVGFSPNSAAGNNLFSKTQFKDSEGNPVGVEVSSDQKLRVTYDLVLSPQPNTQTAGTADITNIGTIGFTHMMQRVQGRGDRRGYKAIGESGLHNDGALEPARAGDFMVADNEYQFASYGSHGGQYWWQSGSIYRRLSSVLQSYTDGNYYRDKDLVLDTTDYQNGQVTSVSMEIDDDYNEPDIFYALVFDSADRFTKADTHRLTFTFRFSWARAA